MRAEYRKTERGKERVAAAVKKDIELRPERRAARVIVGSALRLGKLEKKPCEVCGERQVEAHHDDYSKPLSVRWLCPKHHHEHHKRRASMLDIEQPTFQYRD